MPANPNDEAILEIQSQVDRSFGQHSPRQMQSEALYQILSGMMARAAAEKNHEKLQALLNFMSYIPADCSKRLYEPLIVTDDFRVPVLVGARKDFAARAQEICRLFDVSCIKQLSSVLTLLKKNADHQEVWDFPDTFDFDEHEGGED